MQSQMETFVRDMNEKLMRMQTRGADRDFLTSAWRSYRRGFDDCESESRSTVTIVEVQDDSDEGEPQEN